MFDNENRPLTDAELDGVVAGAGVAGVWSKVGPIVKPILYPTRLVRFTSGMYGVGGSSAGSTCANGVCN